MRLCHASRCTSDARSRTHRPAGVGSPEVRCPAGAGLPEMGPIDGDLLPILVFRLTPLPALRLLAAMKVPLPEGKLGGGLVQVALGEEAAEAVAPQCRHLGPEASPPRRQPLVLLLGEHAERHLVAQEV